MAEPGDVPSPFRPAPIAPQAAGGGGCSKPLFVGCGAVLLLLGIAAIVFVVKAQDLFRWWVGLVEQKVVSVVPDDVTPAERAALQQGFEDLRGLFGRGGQPDGRFLQPFQAKVIEILSKPKGQVTRQEILDLTRILELTAGKRPAPAGATPSDAAPPARPAAAPAPSALPTA